MSWRFTGRMPRPPRCEHCNARIQWASRPPKPPKAKGERPKPVWMPVEVQGFPQDRVPRAQRYRLKDGEAIRDERSMDREPVVVVSHFLVCPARMNAAGYAKLFELWPDLAFRAQLHGPIRGHNA